MTDNEKLLLMVLVMAVLSLVCSIVIIIDLHPSRSFFEAVTVGAAIAFAMSALLGLLCFKARLNEQKRKDATDNREN